MYNFKSRFLRTWWQSHKPQPYSFLHRHLVYFFCFVYLRPACLCNPLQFLEKRKRREEEEYLPFHICFPGQMSSSLPFFLAIRTGKDFFCQSFQARKGIKRKKCYSLVSLLLWIYKATLRKRKRLSCLCFLNIHLYLFTCLLYYERQWALLGSSRSTLLHYQLCNLN